MSLAGWTEFIGIFILAFLIIGPKDFPKVLFALGRMIKVVQGLAEKFMLEFNELQENDKKLTDDKRKKEFSKSSD